MRYQCVHMLQYVLVSCFFSIVEGFFSLNLTEEEEEVKNFVGEIAAVPQPPVGMTQFLSCLKACTASSILWRS